MELHYNYIIFRPILYFLLLGLPAMIIAMRTKMLAASMKMWIELQQEKYLANSLRSQAEKHLLVDRVEGNRSIHGVVLGASHNLLRVVEQKGRDQQEATVHTDGVEACAKSS